MTQPDVQAAMAKMYPSTAKVEAPKPESPALNPRPFGLPDIDPVRAMGKAQEFLAKGPTELFKLAGKADVAQGLKTPEKAEQRSGQYGRLSSELGQAALMPWGTAAGLPGG